MPLPIAHSATGFSIYYLIKGKPKRKEEWVVLGACLVLSILPDLDFVPGFLLGEPHMFHHGVSHSLIASCIAALLSALILIKLSGNEVRIEIVFLCCFLAGLSHPLLDYLCEDYSRPYGVPLFWPFIEDYFIADNPVFLAIDKSGTTFSSFIKSMITFNNCKAAFVEILYATVLLSIIWFAKRRKYYFCFLILLVSVYLFYGCNENQKKVLPNNTAKKVTIRLDDMPVNDTGKGGILVYDIDDDSQKDFIITKPGYIGVWNNLGEKIWQINFDILVTRKAEYEGLPGLHAPGLQIGDIDGDGNSEVIVLSKGSKLNILDGKTGNIEKSIYVEPPKGAIQWEHVVLADFRGTGDHDVLLQATGNYSYRLGKYIAAYSWDVLNGNLIESMWSRDDFIPNAHNGARVADLDGDGRDEVLGGTIITPDGIISCKIPLEGHIDYISVADVRPDIEGLEVVALEEGGGWVPFRNRNRFFYYLNRIYHRLFGTGNHIFLYNINGLIWKTQFKHQEPQNAAIGNFDVQKEGLEIWCRSRYNTGQKPFIFDSRGNFIAMYKIKDVASDNWTNKGVEVITTIDWTGERRQFCVAKERHKSGNIAIFNGLTGEFIQVFKEKADRLYVADVYGDWREEVIVLNGNELHIYCNGQPNTAPERNRLWSFEYYQRSKMTWNYYNP
ncbi:MAG: metal-dependent hydrolase [Desulfobacter sp.]|nr:MAG: metal-dependent hydrolase [Desulfobacter sp.]